MSTETFPIPTERVRLGRVTAHIVPLGPLCVNFASLPAGVGWYVTHLASASTIGQPWRTLPQALAGAGALLAMPIDWYAAEPVADEACARIAREAMLRVRSTLR